MNHTERLEYYKEWRKNNRELSRMYGKVWRKRHINEWRIIRNNQKIRDNDESRLFATNWYSRWTSDEIDYIKNNAKKKTVREMCIDLGRTYGAIIIKAHYSHIKLMTQDKMCGKLVTNKIVRN